MGRLVLTLAVSLVWLPLVAPDVAAGGQHSPGEERIDPTLRAQLARAGSDQVDALVVLTSQADLSGISAPTRVARLAAVERRLRDHATESQASLIEYLQKQRAEQNVSLVRPLWVTNEVEVVATPAVIREVATRPDVLAVRPNLTVQAPTPQGSIGPNASTIEPNISLIHAPQLWSQGYRGQGIVVASMDTGVDATDPDLASAWRGGANSWYDPNGQHPTTPTDVNGHGTQTMGVMVGGDAGGSSVGVAPDAQWIAVKIFNDQGSATSVAIHLGFQWLLDPDGDPATPDAPRVVNNSWSGSVGGCNTEFEPDLAGLRAAGILPIFAAGNYGPTAGTVFSPANLPEAVAVGGIDNTFAIDPASSRGPSACPSAVAPKLVAPGVNIRTTDLFGGFINDTGTSIAAPHVTGAVALLLSAFPGLSADRQESALESGAVDLGAVGLDNNFGYGALDVSAAYQWLATSPDFTASVSPSSVSAPAGSNVSFDVTIAGVNGFSSDVSLSLSGLSGSQASWSFTPGVVSGGSGAARLDVSTSAGLATGTYPLTITASSGTLVRSAQATLIVTPPPDFTLSASPASQTVAPGGSANFTVATGAANGFDADVSLALTGLPGSVGSAVFLPPVVSGPTTSQLTIATSPTAAPGSYQLTIRGTSGSLTHTAAVTLVVSPDFSLTASPSQITIKHGKTATYTVSISPLGGFTGKVNLSASGVPYGATYTFSRTWVPVPGTATFKVRTNASTARGTRAITITGKHSSLTHQVIVYLTVT